MRKMNNTPLFRSSRSRLAAVLATLLLALSGSTTAQEVRNVYGDVSMGLGFNYANDNLSCFEDCRYATAIPNFDIMIGFHWKQVTFGGRINAMFKHYMLFSEEIGAATIGLHGRYDIPLNPTLFLSPSITYGYFDVESDFYHKGRLWHGGTRKGRNLECCVGLSYKPEDIFYYRLDVVVSYASYTPVVDGDFILPNEDNTASTVLEATKNRNLFYTGLRLTVGGLF